MSEIAVKRVPFSLSIKDNYLNIFLPVLAVVFCAIFFHWMSGESFLTARNLSNLSRQVSVNMTLAVGMTLVILTSGIDLSVGSVLALSGMVAAITQVHFHFSEWGIAGAILSFLVALATGGLCGSFTGFAVGKLKITPFIVTLGMMVICRGLTLILSNAQAVAPLGESLGGLSSGYFSPVLSFIFFVVIWVVTLAFYIPPWLKKEKTAAESFRSIFYSTLLCSTGATIFCEYRGIPYMVFFVLAVTGLGMFALKYFRFGRFLYAIGGNREAAELSGIPVKTTLWVVYFVMGCLAGLAGVLDCARSNGAVPTAGDLGELDAIAAVVIGGTSLMGGVGTLTGTVFGVLIMGILNNGMSLMGVSEHYQKVFKGVVIIAAVYMDLRAKKKLG